MVISFVFTDLGSAQQINSNMLNPTHYVQTNATDQPTKHPEELLFPHEIRRRRRLQQDRLYFKRMTEQIKELRDTECTIERVHQPTKETFRQDYMKTGKPVILTGMMDSWQAMKSWDFKELGKNHG